MNAADQIEFVQSLMQGLTNGIVDHIKRGHIPAEWDGHELRQYIADYAKDKAVASKMAHTRMREYRNTVIVRNL